jgi:NADH-quinone oxidoreductase subunit G
MPTVTIDDRSLEVEKGTNLVDAAMKVGVQIPHYCYHPRLSVVGQCRMCLVKVEGMPKLQAGCSTQVMKDGMVVRTDTAEVKDAQRAMMEFLLINHPLDCPICDQAGECGLQDYAFKHGVAFSRFRFEDKRIYGGRERIPLGPNVVLNMNRCIQCTRCVRFTHEVAETGELGFFNRGARAEIGVFPGKQLDGELASNVVDICPVGALTSTRFRFAERVWYLDKKPSICTGCDVGCNITLEHRRGQIRRYKPRFNPEVNDYWMCDYGRGSHERYRQPRLATPRLRRDGTPVAVSWQEALDALHQRLRVPAGGGPVAFLGSGFLTTEEAYLLARLADHLGTPHRAVWAGRSEPFRIPRPQGAVVGRDAAPNRRGAELAGLVPGAGGFDAEQLLTGDAGRQTAVLFVADIDLGPLTHDVDTVARLRQAEFLVVMGWADTPLAQAADLALPVATHAEKEGSFVNIEQRLQRFKQAFPAPAASRPAVAVLVEVLGRLEPEWQGLETAGVFARMAREIPGLAGLSFQTIPPTGVSLEGVAAPSGR